MHYLGQWGGGGPGHSWALKWHRAKRVPFGQHYVPYRWLLISNKLCDSTLCTCGGEGGGWNRCIILILTLLKLWGEGEQREQRKNKRERGDVYTTRVQMALTLAVWCELAVKSPPPKKTRPNQFKSPIQHNTTVWAPHNSMGPGFTSFTFT